MSNYKQTALGHVARKRLNTYLQNHPEEITRDTRRLSYACSPGHADGVMAISGSDGADFALEHYGVDLASVDLLERFNAMLLSYGYRQAADRAAELCAEARLWMTLVALHCHNYGQPNEQPRHRHEHPRQLAVWVYEIARTRRLKEDSPCANCRQWVRHEFALVNGTPQRGE
jgi:hypothetical protein